MSEDTPGERSATSVQPGIGTAIKIDLVRLHDGWMGLLFPRQTDAAHSVLGKWKPTTLGDRIRYRFWEAIGLLLIVFAYPLTVLGFAIRFYTRRIDRTAASIGILGVLLSSVLAWGGLTAFAYLRNFSFEGLVAVGAAGAVATVSAGLSMLFLRIDGRATTVILAYPFAVTAIFLPPVVAALYSPTLASYVFTGSQSIAVWILENVLAWRDLNDTIRYYFDLKGLAYVGMWFAIAVPVGWFLGIVVTLANLVRPSGREE